MGSSNIGGGSSGSGSAAHATRCQQQRQRDGEAACKGARALQHMAGCVAHWELALRAALLLAAWALMAVLLGAALQQQLAQAGAWL